MNPRFRSGLLLALVFTGTSVPAAEAGKPDLGSVWVSVLVAFDDPRWRIADLVCARTGCSVEGFAYLQGLLADPANASQPAKQLVTDMEAYQRNVNEKLLTPAARQFQAGYDPSQEGSLDCTPDGDDLAHQVLAPLPMQIEQHEDTVVLRYEYWNAERTVHLDPAGLPAEVAPSRLGHSIGRYEGSALVIETTWMIPTETMVPSDKPVWLSADAKVVERYELTEDGQALDLTLEIIDPVNFNGPLQNYRRFLRAPGWELDTFECESITGEF